MEKKTIITDDGVELAYFESGKGKDTAVLLAGYGAPAISWCRQVDALNKAGIRTICLDRRCHGLSEKTEKGMNMLRHGADVNELLTQLKIEDAILCGQSQGASTMWAYIKQFGCGKLKAAVSIDQTPKMINEGSWQYGMYGLTPETRAKYFDTPLARPNKKRIDLGVILCILFKARNYPKFDQEFTKELLFDHADADWRDVIRDSNIPLLFVAGSESPFWPKEHAAEMAGTAKKGSYYIVKGSGHAVNWECVSEFNKVLIDFIKEL